MKLFRISALVLTGAVAVALTACEPKDESADGSKDDTVASGKEESKDDDSGTGEDDSGDGQNGTKGDLGEVTSVTLTKSGGISGMEEILEITGDGEWEYIKARMAPKKGNLSGGEYDELMKLVTDKGITAADKKSDKQCNDMQTYTLTLKPAKGDEVNVSTDDCGVSPNERFDDAVELLGEATPI